MSDELKYKRNRELRRDIAYTVGGDPTRYDERKGLNKADLTRLAETLGVENAADMTLSGLYAAVCAASGGDWSPNAGNVWKLNRANLKAIHRAIDADSPHEVIGR